MKQQEVVIIRTEDQESISFAQLLLWYQRQGKVDLYTHIPHETYTKSWRQRLRNTNMGVRRGVPDYIVVTSTHVLFVEMKRTKGGSVAIEQKEWIARLQNKQTHAAVCKGYDEAKAYVEKFL